MRNVLFLLDESVGGGSDAGNVGRGGWKVGHVSARRHDLRVDGIRGGKELSQSGKERCCCWPLGDYSNNAHISSPENSSFGEDFEIFQNLLIFRPSLDLVRKRWTIYWSVMSLRDMDGSRLPGRS